MKFFRILSIILLTGLMSLPAKADPINYRMIISASETLTVLFGERLEESRNRTYPLHLRMSVTDPLDQVVLRSVFHEDGSWAEIVYMTPEGRLVELATVAHATIDDGTPDERLQFIYNVIGNQVFPSIDPPEDAEVLGGRIVEVQGYSAVEFVALFDDPSIGPIAARIVGVVPPGPSRAVLIFVQQTVRNHLAIRDLGDLNATFAGRMLGSIEFTAWRDESGVLRGF